MATPSTTPTSNLVPSQSFSDLLFNAELLDILINAPQEEAASRLGVALETWQGIKERISQEAVDLFVEIGASPLAPIDWVQGASVAGPYQLYYYSSGTDAENGYYFKPSGTGTLPASPVGNSDWRLYFGSPSTYVVTADETGEERTLGGWTAQLSRALPALVVGSGQSNALGGGEAGGGDLTINDRVFAWKPSTQSWVVATPGQEPFPTNTPTRNNLMWQMCKRIQEEEGRDVYFVLSGRGSTSITEWNPETGEQWTDLDTAVTLAMSTPELEGKKVDVFCWMQGENDFYNETYMDQLLAIRQAAIDSGWMEEKTPFLSGSIVAVLNYSRLQQMAYSARLDNDWFTFVSNEGVEVGGDNLHYTGEGLTNWGRGAWYGAYKTTPKNPTPWVQWNPTIRDRTGTATFTYSAQDGGMAINGNRVDLWFRLAVTSHSGGATTADLDIRGMPVFPTAGSATQSSGFNHTGTVSVSGLNTTATSVILRAAGTNGINIEAYEGGDSRGLDYQELEQSFSMRGSISYYL